MPTIVGIIEDSGGIGITGILRVSLDTPMVDTSSTPDGVMTVQARDFAIASGVVNISLAESQTQNLTYFFQFLTTTSSNSYYFGNGTLYTGPFHFHIDGKWYTGATNTIASVLLFQQINTTTNVAIAFHAIVPNIASVEFAALIPTGITTDVLDSSLRRLAEILTSNVDYVEDLRGGPRWKGVYSAVVFYQSSDTVSYAGSSWLYINVNPAVNITPSVVDPTYWQLLAQKGDPGGTGGTDTAYNSVGWDGATWAPTANAVRDIIELLARANDAALTGNPVAPTQAVGNNTTRLATTAYVIAEILSRFASPNFSGIPTIASTPLLPDNGSAIANTNFVKSTFHRYSRIVDSQTSGTNGGSAAAGIQTRSLNSIVENAGDVIALASNRFTLRPGSYRIAASAPGWGVGANRIFLWNVTTSARTLNGKSVNSSAANATTTHSALQGRFTIATNTDFEIRHFCQIAAATFGLGVAATEAAINEIYTEVEIWRLD